MAAEKYLDNIAVICENEKLLTYSQLENYIKHFADNIESRQIVLIVTRNTIASLIGYLGCMENKSIPLLLRKNIDSDTVEKYVEDYDIKYVWLSEDLFDEKKGFLNRNCERVCRLFGYSLFDTGEFLKEVNKELALLLPTSGSTGNSKLVRISYKNIESNTRNIAKYLNITKNDKAITSLPMNYTYGLSVINTHFYKKATLLMTERAPYEKEFWDFFNYYKGTSFAAVPYTYEILKKTGFAKKKVDTLHTMTVAGGKIGLEEEKYFIEYATKNCKKFYVMYGQTEATARISYRPSEMMLEKKESIGIPIPEGKMWIEDNEGNVVKECFIKGEIVYSGDNVTMGYAQEKGDLLKGYDWGNMLHTKDIGYMDDDGYFYICGRKDRTAKLNGIRIELDELEKILKNKFPKMDFNCKTEKCMDSVCFTRIKIICQREKIVRHLELEEVVIFISKKTGLSKRYFRIIEGVDV